MDDLISRQAVIEYIEGSGAELGHSSENELVCQDIKELPSVTPQPKIGHWILKRTFPTKLYDEYLNEYKCSECYREIRCTENQLVNFPYCHCGAKMIEPQKSDVLDKIRAEIIEDIEKYNDIYDDTCHGLRMALDIIDKYKAESEDKE